MFPGKVGNQFRSEVCRPAAVRRRCPAEFRLDVQAVFFAFADHNFFGRHESNQIERNRANAFEVRYEAAPPVWSALLEFLRVTVPRDLIEQFPGFIGVVVAGHNRPERHRQCLSRPSRRRRVVGRVYAPNDAKYLSLGRHEVHHSISMCRAMMSPPRPHSE